MSTEMMAMTTRSSISVKPRRRDIWNSPSMRKLGMQTDAKPTTRRQRGSVGARIAHDDRSFALSEQESGADEGSRTKWRQTRARSGRRLPVAHRVEMLFEGGGCTEGSGAVPCPIQGTRCDALR